MDLMFLIGVIIFVIIIFFILSILKKLIKIALMLGIIFVVLFLITGGAIMNDFSNLKDKIDSATNLVLLEYNSSIITGFVDGKELKLLSEQEIALINDLYNNKKLEDIKGTNYKLFIIKTSVIDELKSIKVNNKDVDAQQLNDFFISNRQIRQITPEDIGLEIKAEGNNKARLFAYIYEKNIRMTKAAVFFFKNYKSENIIVYPETIFFKAAKVIPIVWIEGKLNKLEQTAEDKAKQAITGAVALAKEKRGA